MFGSLKKLARKAGKYAIGGFKKSVQYGTGGMVNLDKGKDDSARSDAADQLLQKRDVPIKRQAGGGQISYTGEELQ